MSESLTAFQFECAYAARANMTVEHLRGLGRAVFVCPCDEDICEGWRSGNAQEGIADLEDEVQNIRADLAAPTEDQ